MDPFAIPVVRDAYDAVAQDYAAAFGDDLRQLPVDRAVLDAAFEYLDSSGPVLDLGCGPGQVGQYLSERGAEVIAVDLSPRMLNIARRHTEVRTGVCADLRALPFRSGSVAATVAFYSLHHLPRAELGVALDEVRRVLSVEGVLVVATHLGDGEVFADEFLGQRIPTTGGSLYGRQELETALRTHSLVVEMTRVRGPLPHEHQSQRIYVIARPSSR